MDNTDTRHATDTLNDAACKMTFVADLFCSTNTKDLFLTENGLAGLVNILWNIRDDIEKAEQALSKA